MVLIFIEKIPVATLSDDDIHCPPVDLVMEDFLSHKTKGKSWLSPFFYTHYDGYRMCLEVTASGYGRGRDTHVSVFAHLVATEKLLKWPFRGAITVSLLNQLGDRHHVTHTITFSDGTPTDACTRVDSEMVSSSGWGIASFVAHSTLSHNKHNAAYLSKDRLHFRIEKFTTISSHVAIVRESTSYAASSIAEFTVTEFNRLKASGGGIWQSPPFSVPPGYKFRLLVTASERDDESVHITVGIRMTKGYFDDSLAFPFRGYFFIEVINWQQEHIKKTISVTDFNDNNRSVGGRVTKEELVDDFPGMSILQPGMYMDHMLSPVPVHYYTTDTQYCIRIRVLSAHATVF